MLDFRPWAISSVAERFLHTEEATGSIPVSPTIPLLLLLYPTIFMIHGVNEDAVIVRSGKTSSILDRTDPLGYTFSTCGNDQAEHPASE